MVYMGGIGRVYMGHWMGVHGGHWMGVQGGIGWVYMGGIGCVCMTHVGHSMGTCDRGHWMSEHRALNGSWLYMWPTSWTMVPVKPQQALFPIPQAFAPLIPHCLNTICRNR